MVGAEIAGAIAGVFATLGAWCFRAKMMLAATRIIAAAADEVTRIRAVEFELLGGFGSADGGVNLAAVTKCSAAGTMAACGGGSCGSGGAMAASWGEAVPESAFLDATGAAGASPARTGLGATLFGAIGLGAIWPVLARAASGALGRGT